MIMAYTTEPFRISTIVTYLHFFACKGNRKEIFIMGFFGFVGILNSLRWFYNRKGHERQHKHFIEIMTGAQLNLSLLLLPLFLGFFIKPQSSRYLYVERWRWNRRGIRPRGYVRWPLFLSFGEKRGVP